MNYLLDTNVVIDYFNHKDPGLSLVPKLSKKHQLYVSLLTVTEIRSGWTREDTNILFPRFYNLFHPVELTQSIAEVAGEIRYDYARKGIQLSVVDSVLATTAILGNYTFITRNKKHFPMRELKMFKGL